MDFINSVYSHIVATPPSLFTLVSALVAFIAAVAAAAHFWLAWRRDSRLRLADIKSKLLSVCGELLLNVDLALTDINFVKSNLGSHLPIITVKLSAVEDKMLIVKSNTNEMKVKIENQLNGAKSLYIFERLSTVLSRLSSSVTTVNMLRNNVGVCIKHKDMLVTINKLAKETGVFPSTMEEVKLLMESCCAENSAVAEDIIKAFERLVTNFK